MKNLPNKGTPVNTYKIRWQSKDVTVHVHSELDDLLKSCFESLVERSLTFNNNLQKVADDNYSLSQYNKGEFIFLVEQTPDGFIVNYCSNTDLEEHKIEPSLSNLIRDKMGLEPLILNKQSAFLTSTRKMPWT